MIPYKHITLQSAYSDAKEQIEENFLRLSTGSVHGRHLSYEIPKEKVMHHWDESIVTLQVHAAQLAAGWPATSYVDIVPQLRFNPNYGYAADCSIICTDPGAGTGTGAIREMKWDDGTATWSGVSDITTFTIGQSDAGGATGTAPQVVSENQEYLLSYSAGEIPVFGLYANVADATALTGTGTFLRVELRIRQHPRSS